MVSAKEEKKETIKYLKNIPNIPTITYNQSFPYNISKNPPKGIHKHFKTPLKKIGIGNLSDTHSLHKNQ